MSQWDAATGEYSQQPSRGRQVQKKVWGTRNERLQSRSADKPRTASSVKPDEVSDRAWSIAQFWIQEGEKTFGQRPPVNLAEFSRRLQNVIVGNPEMVSAIQGAEGRNQDECGAEYVEDLVMEMVVVFWRELTQGDTLTPGLQFKFLVDEWDRLEDRCRTTLRVRRILRNPHRVTAFEVSKSENPYLLAVAANTMGGYLNRALSEDPEDSPGMHRKRNLRKPSHRAV